MRSLISFCRIAAQTMTAILFCSAAFAYETRVEPDAHLVEGHLLAPGACMYDETGQCIYVAPVRFGEPIFVKGRPFEAEINGKPATFQQIKRLVRKPSGSVTYQDILNGVDPFYELWGYAQTDDLKWISFNQLCRNDNTEVTLNSPSIYCNGPRCEVDVKYSVVGDTDTVEFEAEIEVLYQDGRRRTFEEDEYEYFASYSTEIDFNIPGPPDAVRSVTVTDVSCDIW